MSILTGTMLANVLLFSSLLSVGEAAQITEVPQERMISLMVAEGLPEQEARRLLIGMASTRSLERMQRIAVASKKENIDFVPCLMMMLRELGDGKTKIPVKVDPEYARLFVRNPHPSVDGLCAYTRLCMFSDPRAEQSILDFFERNAPKTVTQMMDTVDFDDLLVPLGFQKTERVVELLVRMLDREFWLHDFGLAFHIKATKECSSEELAEWVLSSIRCNALVALSYSGTDRALEMLSSGDGVPVDLQRYLEDGSLFRRAVREKVGILGYPEFDGQALPPETIAHMTEIFQKYGLTYTEDPSIERLRQDVDVIFD